MRYIIRIVKIILISSTFVLLSPQSRTDAQDVSGYSVTILPSSFSSLMRFNTESAVLEQVSSGLDSAPGWRGELSPQRRKLIYWVGWRVQNDGVWLLDFDEPETAFHISLPLETEWKPDSEDVMAQWIMGERFVIIRTIVYDNSVYHRLPQPEISYSWLVDVRDRKAIPWYWECNEIVHLWESAAFALRCPLADFVKDTMQQEAMFLTVDGPVEDLLESFNTIYRDGNPFLLFREFSPRMDKVAYGELVGLKRNVSIYEIDGVEHEKLMTAEFIRKLTWSQSGRYLAVIDPCFEGKTACFSVIDSESHKVMWDNHQLHVDQLEDVSVTWLTDETEFFVLGRDLGIARWILWHVSLDREDPIARWELVGGTLVGVMTH